MPQAPIVPADENVAPSNAPPANPLLAGACDDDDNELTAEQQKIIADRLAALQARFKAFEEKTLKQKVDELVLANEGLTEAEAEMTLRVCNGNEFEASDRLSNADEDHEQFRKSIKRLIRDEQRSAHLGVRAKAKVEERLARKRKRLARRRDQYADDDDEDIDREEESEWEESEDEPEDPMDDEPLQEVRFGVHFVRHKKTHKVGGRLKLDDALSQLAAAQAAQAEAQKKAEEDLANGVVVEGEGAEGAEGAAAEGGAEDADGGSGAASPTGAAAPPVAPSVTPDDLMEGWSDARKKAWSNRLKNENQYYYRFNEPGEPQAEGKWTPEQHTLFMATLESVRSGAAGYPMYQWGSFSKNIPGRVGYQCSNYYRTLIKNGDVQDSNYMVDETGQMRFNFKNKGFERVNKETGESELLVKKPKKVYVPKPKKEKKPKAPPKPKPKKKKVPKEEKDLAFHCSIKFDSTRRSGRNAGSTKKYTDGDGSDNDDEEEEPVLPGFVDPLTKTQIEEPAISPYGHVAGYETWCKVLRSEDGKDTCPFTRQPLRRRDLVKLTHDNIAEYREKMVDTQNA